MATATTTKKVTPRKTAAKIEPVKTVRAPRAAVTAKLAPVAAKTVAAVAPKADSLKLFVLLVGARPTSGFRLWSHTQAAFEVLGMIAGAAVKKNALVSVVGARAVGYHVDNANLEERGGSVKITETGQRTFRLRTTEKAYKPKLTEAFKAMFLKGKPNTEFGIKEDNLVQVGLSLR